jgi:hypothetical protein
VEARFIGISTALSAVASLSVPACFVWSGGNPGGKSRWVLALNGFAFGARPAPKASRLGAVSPPRAVATASYSCGSGEIEIARTAPPG